MKLHSQKFSKPVFAEALRVVTLALFLVVFVAGAAPSSLATNTVTAPDDQVPFTVIGTAVVTGVTHLPGGLTQVDINVAAKATHLGDITGPWTRIQDHQGNFSATGSLSEPTGRTVCSFPSVGSLRVRRISVWWFPPAHTP
jgi:hypothetical protein